MIKYILLILLAINLITFCAYGLDKYKARKNKWRIPEKTLLLMGLCFSSIGQLLGMRIFRHKTHKWYFWVCGVVSLIIQAVLFYYFCTKYAI